MQKPKQIKNIQDYKMNIGYWTNQTRGFDEIK